MVEDTIRTIRETEKQAHEIVENARECIMKDAQERAEELREEIIKKAQDEAAAEIESARMAGAEKESSAKAAYEAETAKLKTSAGEKEKEAVEMVISLLA